MASDGEGSAAAPPQTVPAKRSLFQNSAWAKPTAPAGQEKAAVEFFSRSKDLFSGIVADNKREQQRKREREREREREKTKKINVDEADFAELEGKRRRLSTPVEDRGISSSDEGQVKALSPYRASSHTTPPSARSQSASSRNKHEVSPRSASKTYNGVTRSGGRLRDFPGALPSTSISLQDSDDDVRPIRNVKAAKTILVISDDEQSEEEFPEFIKQAQNAEKNASKRLQDRLAQLRTKNAAVVASSDAGSNNFETNKSFTRDVSLPAPDPIVDILVTSDIEGTVPLIVRRRISQRLKDVRIAWCEKQKINGQPMNEDTRAMMFLTWRGKRLFDVTTCKSMGITVNAAGHIRGGGEGFDGDGKLHLQVWTEETFKEYNEQKDRKRRQHALLDEDDNDNDNHDDEPVVIQPKEDEVKWHIILIAKDLEPFKLVVKPGTSITKIINAFRTCRNVPMDKQISLQVDGDTLDPGGLAGDADLDDMCTIDVHIN